MNLGQLRTLARQESDQENSNFIQDSEFNNYINGSYGELYDIFVSRFEDQFSSIFQFTVASGVSSQALPSDFYKMRGLDYLLNSPDDWLTVRSYNLMERNTYNRARTRTLLGGRQISYRMLGQNITLLPSSNASGTYRLIYIPRVVKLVNDSDEMGNVLDFEEYVIVDAAIKAMQKEESDVSTLMARKQGLTQRILALAANRDSGDPERIGDVSYQGNLIDFTIPR